MKGTLYIVATPIGNLEDITLRALRVLKEVDVIAVEDTRHSLKLLNHYGISKPLISYWAEREKIKSEEVLKRLNSCQSVALISDSGTPGISDPGGVLIRKALDSGILVVPVPGPSALIAALSISGLSEGEFTFIGFLSSRKRAQRVKALKTLSLEQRTLVFYEAPHRLIETLADMEEVFGSRRAVVIKEITKLHEESLHGSIPELRAVLQEKTIAGEYVIIVEGRKINTDAEASFDEALSEVMALIKKGMGRKEAVKVVAGEYGISKNELYERSLQR